MFEHTSPRGAPAAVRSTQAQHTMYIGLHILHLIYIFITVCFRQNLVPTPKAP